MPETASIHDVVSIAQREAGRARKKIIGVTASAPQYVSIPDADDPGAQLEWVVSVRLIDGTTQAVVSDAPGLQILPNVMISHAVAGDIIGDIGTPVELDVGTGGQLMVVGRAKVDLPDLNMSFFSLADLGLAFIDDHEFDSDGVLRDPFGDTVSPKATRSFTMSATIRLATLEELGEDDAGTTTGWGFQIFQRTIADTPRTINIAMTELIATTESSS